MHEACAVDDLHLAVSAEHHVLWQGEAQHFRAMQCVRVPWQSDDFLAAAPVAAVCCARLKVVKQVREREHPRGREAWAKAPRHGREVADGGHGDEAGDVAKEVVIEVKQSRHRLVGERSLAPRLH